MSSVVSSWEFPEEGEEEHGHEVYVRCPHCTGINETYPGVDSGPLTECSYCERSMSGEPTFTMPHSYTAPQKTLYNEGLYSLKDNIEGHNEMYVPGTVHSNPEQLKQHLENDHLIDTKGLSHEEQRVLHTDSHSKYLVSGTLDGDQEQRELGHSHIDPPRHSSLGDTGALVSDLLNPPFNPTDQISFHDLTDEGKKRHLLEYHRYSPEYVEGLSSAELSSHHNEEHLPQYGLGRGGPLVPSRANHEHYLSQQGTSTILDETQQLLDELQNRPSRREGKREALDFYFDLVQGLRTIHD